MQIKKAGVVAAGAIATVAAMGAPAAAAVPNADVAALTRASMLNLARNMDTDPQALVVAGTGSAISAAPWQPCGSSTVAGVGGTISLVPAIMFGACNNSNIKIKDKDTVVPAIGAINDSAVLAAPWQVCSSDTVAGVGGVVTAQSPKTNFGGCRNANVVITSDDEDGYMTESAMVGEQHAAVDRTAGVQQVRAAWAARKDAAKPAAAPRHVEGPRGAGGLFPETEPQALVSAISGSAVIAAPWQVCGSNAVAGVGGTIAVQSPKTQWQDCDNSNVKISQEDPTAVISALDNSAVLAAAWQVCASDTVAGVGGVINVGSPVLMFGDCNNGNVVID